MNTDKPLVSIVLPVHNCVLYLKTCLESLLAQSYFNIEIIAIDDKSRDGSFQVLASFKRKDKRVKISRNKKRYGLAVCFNRAIRQAEGQFITFMDPKDASNPSRIQKQVEFLLSSTKTVAVGSQCTYVDHNDKKIGKSTFPKHSSEIAGKMLTGASLQFETVVVNKTLLPKDILYFKTNKYPFIFSDVFMRLFQYGEFANLKENLHIKRRMRQHTDSIASKVNSMVTVSKLFLKSMTVHNYRPPIRSLISPLAK